MRCEVKQKRKVLLQNLTNSKPLLASYSHINQITTDITRSLTPSIRSYTSFVAFPWGASGWRSPGENNHNLNINHAIKYKKATWWTSNRHKDSILSWWWKKIIYIFFSWLSSHLFCISIPTRDTAKRWDPGKRSMREYNDKTFSLITTQIFLFDFWELEIRIY